ncbi:MAG: hypothetical protein GY801_45675 [bacterium]|nr:hypothetical protein [bacterium]
MMTIADTYIEEGIEKGIERGIQRGILQNAKEDVIDALEIRFSEIPQRLINAINDVREASILKVLHRKAIQAESLEAFERLVYEILR